MLVLRLAEQNVSWARYSENPGNLPGLPSRYRESILNVVSKVTTTTFRLRGLLGRLFHTGPNRRCDIGYYRLPKCREFLGLG